EVLAVLTSGAPEMSAWSEGLMGEASMRTMTSSGFGSGVGTLASDISTMPSFLTIDRSWSPVRALVVVICRLRCRVGSAPSTSPRSLPAGPVADRRLRPRVLGVDVGRLRGFLALRGERLGRGRGGDEAVFRAADEVAPAGVHERLVDDEPGTGFEELHQRALRLPVAQLLAGVDGRHGQRVDPGVVDARRDVHRRRDEVLHLPRPVAVLLQKDG